MQAFVVQISKMVVGSRANISDTERQLAYVRSRYMFGGYIFSESNNDWKNI